MSYGLVKELCTQRPSQFLREGEGTQPAWGRGGIMNDKEERKPSKTTMCESGSTACLAHILLAEDDDDMRTLLARSLCAKGYEVTQCRDGLEVLEHLAEHMLPDIPQHFDLIISDIRMPGFSGLEILEGFNEAVWFPPMILITAFGDRKTHDRARRSGAAAVLDKPFELDLLLAEVRQIVSFHGGLRDRGNNE
jgi:two-component system response regulator (stage 0 sporulation protein F)